MAVNINIPKPTYTKSDIGLSNVDNTSDANKPISDDTQTALNNKVDKVTGKGLSTEDYTSSEKSKLSGIQAGAEVNVNADWNATSGDAQILNKPTIPSISNLVPYTGATADVDLGTFGLDAKFVKIKGTGGNGHLNLKHQSSGATAGGSETALYAGSDGELYYKNDGNAIAQIASRAWVAAQGFITNVITALGYTPVPNTRTVNGKVLNADISLTASDVGAPSGSGTSTGTNTGDETQASILSKLGWFSVKNQVAGTASSGTSNTISKSIALPFVPTNLKFRAVGNKTNTNNTYTIRAYLSEVDNNITGTAILIATVTSSNGLLTYLPLNRQNLDIIGGNIIGLNAFTSQLTDDVQVTNARLNAAIPSGSPLYLIFTVQCVSALDSARIESVEISNF